MPHHVIQRQTFDTLLDEGLDHHMHYRKLKQLIEVDIQRILRQVLDTYFPADHRVQIDKLELDLGFLSYDNFEHELPKRLEAELTEALLPYLRPQIFDSHYEAANEGLQKAKALAIFLQSGLFPWWIGNQFKHQRNQHFQATFSASHAASEEIIRQLRQSASSRKRLVHQFDEIATRLTIRKVEPLDAPFIEQYAKDLLTIQLESKIVPVSFSAFKKLRWELILTYLFLERGNVFNNISFVKSTLLQLAGRYNTDYDSLLGFLLQKLHFQRPSHRFRSNFPSILLHLGEEIWGLTEGQAHFFREKDQNLQQVHRLRTKLSSRSAQLSHAEFTWLIGSQQTFEKITLDIPSHLVIRSLSEQLSSSQWMQFLDRIAHWGYGPGFAHFQTIKHIWEQLNEREVPQKLPSLKETYLQEIWTKRIPPQQTQRFTANLLMGLTETHGLPLAAVYKVWTKAENDLDIVASISGEKDLPFILPTKKNSAYDLVRFRRFLVLGPVALRMYRFQLFPLIKRLSRRAKKKTRKILYAEAANLRSRSFVIEALDESELGWIVRLLQPKEAPFIESLSAELQSIHDTQNILPLSSSAFFGLKWEIILQSLIEDRGSRFNQKSFLGHSLKQLASASNLDYTTFVLYLKELTAQLPTTQSQTWVWMEFLQEVIQEVHIPSPSPSASQVVQHIMRHGTYALSFNQIAVEKFILHIKASDIPDIRTVFEEYFQQRSSRKNFIQTLGIQAGLKLLQKVSNHNLQEVVTLFHLLRAQYTQTPWLNLPQGQFEFHLFEVFLLHWKEWHSGTNTLLFLKSMLVHLGASTGISTERAEIAFTRTHQDLSPDIEAFIQKINEQTPNRPVEAATPPELQDLMQMLAGLSRNPMLSPPQIQELISKLQLVLEKDSEALLKLFRANAVPPSWIQILTSYLPSPLQKAFLQPFTHQQGGAVTRFLALMQRDPILELLPSSQRRYFIQVIKEDTFFFALARRGFAFSMRQFIVEHLSRWSQRFGIPLEELWTNLFKASQRMPQQALRGLIHELFQSWAKRQPQVVKVQLHEEEKTIPQSKTVLIEETMEEEKKDSLLIENAGLVLLTPYVKLLMERLDLVKSGRFIDTEAAIRGVFMLQFAATGEARGPEYLLALNKLICNLPFSTPLPEEVDIKPEEEALIEGLLGSINQSWAPLRNSSIIALRETFLQREGLILFEEEKTIIKVQRKGALDILLESLPWGISMINLPWREEILYVEW
ncbi:MAG: contractile injection system tape measure protein [Bacteroidota bacterium]